MKEKINNLELSSTVFLILFSCTIGIAPYTTIKIAGINAYIGVIIGTIIGLVPLLMFIYISNYEIDKPLYIKTKIIFGKVLGTIINIILIILYLILATTILFNTSNFIISQYLTDTPIILVTIIFALTGYHAINKGINTITKTSLIYTIIIIILFILATIGLIPEIELDNLKPILEYGINKPFIAGLTYSLILTIPISSLVTIPKSNIDNYQKTTKYIIITYLITTIMVFFMSFVTSACLGKYLLLQYQYPVYITLKRISIFGFIDRCFVEAPKHVSAESWSQTKEFFVLKGKSHSPYFQDIAGEFLLFCQEKESFDANILALMDFENTQLLAEVSLAKVPEKFEWNKYSVMQLSDAAYLKSYEVDFLSSDFKQFDENPMQAVIWRDSDFNILQQRLSELDFWLLSYIQEQPSSLEEVLSALNTVVEDSTPLIPLLENTWVNWINAEVLYPKV